MTPQNCSSRGVVSPNARCTSSILISVVLFTGAITHGHDSDQRTGTFAENRELVAELNRLEEKVQRLSDELAESRGLSDLMLRLAGEPIAASEGLYKDRILVVWSAYYPPGRNKVKYYDLYVSTKDDFNAPETRLWLSNFSAAEPRKVIDDQLSPGEKRFYWLRPRFGPEGAAVNALTPILLGPCSGETKAQ